MGDLAMKRGDNATVTETVGPSGLTSSGVAGWSFWFTAKLDISDADVGAIIRKLPADWAIQTVGNATTAGVVICTLNPSDTSGLPPYQVELNWDVQAKDTNGHIFTVDSGLLTVTPDVTITTT